MLPDLPDLQIIDGPTAPVGAMSDWTPGVVFSIQLPSGLVITNPMGFPSELPDPPQPPTRD